MKNYKMFQILKGLRARTWDLQKKESFHIKQQRGEFIGAWAPYGYSKSPEDVHKLVPNPDTAPVVQRMFQMRLQGLSYQMIARTLNEEGIASPARYLVDSGLCKSETFAKSVWKVINVKTILAHQVYIGNMVQGVKRQSFYDGRKQHYLPEDAWTVVEGTHAPIVDTKDFYAVQDMAKAVRENYFANLGKFDGLGKSENILQGVVYCACCGKPLVRYKSVSHGKKLWYTFICPTHSAQPDVCSFVSIREDDLLRVMQEAVTKQIALAVDMAELANSVNASPSKRKKAGTLQSQLEWERKALARCENLRDSLYQSYVDRLMTEREYMAMKERYTSEAGDHTTKIAELERQIEAAKDYTTENQFLASFGLIQDATITRELLYALVDKVEITTDNCIEIKFRYKAEFERLNEYLRMEASPDEYRSKVSAHLQ